MFDFIAAAVSIIISESAASFIFIIFSIISIMIKNLSEKFSVLITVLIKESHLKESRLCESAAIK